jgi:RNase H-like domain found in reverse transcriptase
VLQLADPSRPHIVKCDASDVIIGALLGQESKKGAHPVTFAFRKLSGAEITNPVHERQLLPIVYALKEWPVHVRGTDNIS